MSETWAEKSFDVILVCEHIWPIKCQAKFVVDDNINLFSLFSEKTSVDISCELSAKMIHMKCQDLFSVANKIIKKNSQKLLSAAVVIGDSYRWAAEIKKQEDHDGPISLTWANRFAYLMLKFQASSLL